MNHLKIYNNIIHNAQVKKRRKLVSSATNYIYYERHHILPKCLGGSDSKDNLVLLTAKEHYICHKLLTYIYKGNRKIACAFHKMTFGKINKHIKSSRDYAYARELVSNIPISEETRNKFKNRKGENHPMFGRHHNQNTKDILKSYTKEKNSRYYIIGDEIVKDIVNLYTNNTNFTITDIQKIFNINYYKIKNLLISNDFIIRKPISRKKGKNIKEFMISLYGEIEGFKKYNNLIKKNKLAHLGEKNYNYGKKFSKEHKQKISKSHSDKSAWSRGKKFSKEHKQKISEGLKRYYDKIKMKEI